MLYSYNLKYIHWTLKQLKSTSGWCVKFFCFAVKPTETTRCSVIDSTANQWALPVVLFSQAILPFFAIRLTTIGPSYEAAINGLKRGQEGIASEAKFLCWKFPIVKPNFVIFFDEVLQTYYLEKILLLDTYKYCQSNQKFSSQIWRPSYSISWISGETQMVKMSLFRDLQVKNW